jgi:hypothetical protein
MKYIDADKLIAEIVRMRKINRKAFEAEHIESDIFHGRTQAINHLFEFITSLQQEQSEVDLESEMDKYFKTMEVLEHENIFEDTFQRIAKHFFELGLKAKQK